MARKTKRVRQRKTVRKARERERERERGQRLKWPDSPVYQQF